LCRLARRPELLDGVKSERGFLIRLAHHLAIDNVRRRTARERKHTAFARTVRGSRSSFYGRRGRRECRARAGVANPAA
jgi:DNA-directed RNA polymerase specialized sigma24 family protein